MNHLDLWAGLALAGAGFLTGLRANMLKPLSKAFSTAPQPVSLALASLAAVNLGFSVPLILGLAHATAREAIVYTFMFVVALVLMVNLYLQAKRSPAAAPDVAAPAQAANAAAGGLGQAQAGG
ncbi:MAG: hypothetical protein ACXU82_03775 [Caulobacteraceae bacterium]